jgi:hypothetical protein
MELGLPHDPHEFIVVRPFIRNPAAARLVHRAPQALCQLFGRGLYRPAGSLGVKSHDPRQGIFFLRALLLVAENTHKLAPVRSIDIQHIDFAAYRMGFDLLAGWTERNGL